MTIGEIREDARVKSFEIVGGQWELTLKDGLCFRNGSSVVYFRLLKEVDIILNSVIHKNGKQ